MTRYFNKYGPSSEKIKHDITIIKFKTFNCVRGDLQKRLYHETL